MKFQCDRCKTRYSIGDEKVHGKVLKIRCKNCSTIITVRESGASVAGPDEARPPSQVPNATPAPSLTGNSAAGDALEDAFHRAMSRLPSPKSGVGGFHPGTNGNGANGHGANGGPAHAPAPGKSRDGTTQVGLTSSPTPAPTPAPSDDEWYVSVGGGQEGPFSAEQARRRIAQKRAGEEMFAWRDGQEDWLPVDKIAELAPPASRAPSHVPGPPMVPSDAPASRSAGGLAAAAAASAAPRKEDAPRLAELAAAVQQLEAEDDGNFEFDISEASRYVRMPMPPAALGLANATPRTGMPGVSAPLAPQNGRSSGAMPRLGATTGPASVIATSQGLAGGLISSLPPVAAPVRRRRVNIYLAAGGGLVASSILVVFLYLMFRNGGDADAGAGSGGAAGTYLDDFYNSGGGLPGWNSPIVMKQPEKPGDPVAAATRTIIPRPVVRPSSAPPVAPDRPVATPNGKGDSFIETERIDDLRVEDVLGKASANQVALKQCYLNAGKRDPTIGRVIKIIVSITINADGSVGKVGVPGQASYLGDCLKSQIGRWRFKKSTEGLNAEFPLLFTGG